MFVPDRSVLMLLFIFLTSDFPQEIPLCELKKQGADGSIASDRPINSQEEMEN